MTDRLLSAEDVAELLGVRRDFVYELSRRGDIPTICIGRYRRYRRESIDAWLRGTERGTVLVDSDKRPGGAATPRGRHRR